MTAISLRELVTGLRDDADLAEALTAWPNQTSARIRAAAEFIEELGDPDAIPTFEHGFDLDNAEVEI